MLSKEFFETLTLERSWGLTASLFHKRFLVPSTIFFTNASWCRAMHSGVLFGVNAEYARLLAVLWLSFLGALERHLNSTSIGILTLFNQQLPETFPKE